MDDLSTVNTISENTRLTMPRIPPTFDCKAVCKSCKYTVKWTESDWAKYIKQQPRFAT